MRLTIEEQEMLDGKQGPGIQKDMELLVALGETFGAERMIEITRAHVALSGQEGDTYFCELLVRGGAKCKIAPSTNPSWDLNLTKYYTVTDKELELNKKTIEAYTKIGAILNFCCIPELKDNVPTFGEHVAFSESSATPYVNSVLGARTNRESSPSALAAAVIGKTPEYGFHLDENRKGTILVNVEANLKDEFDWGMMGWYVGKYVGSEIPVFNVKNLNKYHLPEKMLYMGAELNTSGAVAMYHIVGVTPEAPTLEKAFGNNKPKFEINVTDTHIKQTQEEISEKSGKINLVMLGCPHYTLDQIKDVAKLLEGKKVHEGVAFWILTSFATIELAKRSGYLETIEKAGACLVPDTCIDEPCWKSFEGGLGITDSPKCAYYRERRGQPFVIRRLEDCVEAAVKGEI
jgi:hypothetical protein